SGKKALRKKRFTGHLRVPAACRCNGRAGLSATRLELLTERRTGRLAALCGRADCVLGRANSSAIHAPCVLASHPPIAPSRRVVIPLGALGNELVAENSHVREVPVPLPEV